MLHGVLGESVLAYVVDTKNQYYPQSERCNAGSGKKNLTKPRQLRAEPPIGKSKDVHNICQVDAKENITTLDGKPACYLTITDEKTGSWLCALTFGYGRISQVPVEEVRQRLIQYFARWGKPGAMRVDNGEPLGHPTMTMTSPLALWLISIDIDMIWNKPRCPQQNGVVEKMQATSARWVELDKIKDLTHLQTRLDQEAFLQREKLPVKRLGNKTRIECFPELETSPRSYHPDDFNEQRVYNFLSKKIYTRKVSSVGTISHYGHIFSVGTKFRGQYVQLKFDEQSIEWIIYDNQKEIKRRKAHHLAKEAILNLTVCQGTTNSFMSD